MGKNLRNLAIMGGVLAVAGGVLGVGVNAVYTGLTGSNKVEETVAHQPEKPKEATPVPLETMVQAPSQEALVVVKKGNDSEVNGYIQMEVPKGIYGIDAKTGNSVEYTIRRFLSEDRDKFPELVDFCQVFLFSVSGIYDASKPRVIQMSDFYVDMKCDGFVERVFHNNAGDVRQVYTADMVRADATKEYEQVFTAADKITKQLLEKHKNDLFK